MNSKNFILIFCLSLFISLSASANFDMSKFKQTTPPPKKPSTSTNCQKPTLDAPIDNKVYLGILFGAGLLYLGIRKYKKVSTVK